jgi:type II secretory pathway component PulF
MRSAKRKRSKNGPELESRWRESLERVVRLTLDQDQIQRELAAMEFPADLRFGFAVLVIFALSGVVLPIVLMATQPEDMSLLWRIVVVIGFLLGLLGLGLFLDAFIGTAEGAERWSWLRGRFGK